MDFTPQSRTWGVNSIRFPGKELTLRPNLGLVCKVKFCQFFAIFLNQSFEQMNQYDLEDLHPTRLQHMVKCGVTRVRIDFTLRGPGLGRKVSFLRGK